MSKVYEIHPDGTTRLMERVRCRNEEAELQLLLEHNPDLLPGDQIDPEEPRRWLLVKREMPVPDPATGANRWNIDFFFLDQDAIPTFVECKRFADTRSRREVVGQMLEYAANGHHYWKGPQLRELASAAAQKRGLELDEAVRNLRPTDDLEADAFFMRAQENLRQGQVRVIFFMEKSPFELRSAIDFLNGQMERTEVLLVEARQYMASGYRVVAPMLFGFTEQARLAKRTLEPRAPGTRRKWDERSFFDEVGRLLATDQTDAVRAVLEEARNLRCEISWGTGRERGSFSLKAPELARGSFLTIYTDGTLSLNFGFLSRPGEDELRETLRESARARIDRTFKPDLDQLFPSLGIEAWAPIAPAVASLIRDVLNEARGTASRGDLDSASSLRSGEP